MRSSRDVNREKTRCCKGFTEGTGVKTVEVGNPGNTFRTKDILRIYYSNEETSSVKSPRVGEISDLRDLPNTQNI